MLRKMLLAMLLCALFVPVAAMAQDGPLPMVWVRYYQVKPGMGGDFTGQMTGAMGPVLDGLVNDGSLLSWGMAEPLTLAGQKWTHLLWMAMPGWAGADGLVGAVAEAQSSMSAEEMAAFEGTLVEGSRHDRILRHVALPQLEAAAPLGYLRLSYFKAHFGMDGEMLSLFEDLGTPVYSRLMAEGKVSLAGMSVQEIVTESDWTHIVWSFTPDLAGVGAVAAATGAALAAEGPAIGERITTATEVSAYHSEILRVTHVGADPPTN